MAFSAYSFYNLSPKVINVLSKIPDI